MSPIEDLPTVAEVNAVPHATPKHQLATRLDRAIASKAARLLDAKKLRTWAYAVKDRDKWKDRKTGRRVRRCLELDPDRAEAHHIEPKENMSVRYDVRNGLCLSLATHDAVTTGKLTIEGTAWFTVKGCRYIDGTAPVIFVRT
jgi:hypothetical protein